MNRGFREADWRAGGQDEAACASFGKEVVVAFTKKTGLAVEAIRTVREGEEPEEFWDCFELG